MQRIFSIHNIRRSTLYLALALVTGIQFGMAITGADTNEAYGQGTAQVVLTGIPPVLSSPYISDLERSYEQGLFTTQFIFVSPSRQPQSFRFNLTLEVNGETLIDMVSEPNQYAPGIHVYRTFDDEPAITFPLSFPDIIQQLEASVDQTGLLPEGDYVLSIEPVSEDEQALIPTIPGMTFFSVRYAEPPLLLTPFDQSNITTQFPVFSWTPITGAPLTSTFEYEFILVEVFQGQAPYQAIESNIPLVREGMVGQTSFVYSMEELPLEERKIYAWQVRARDVNEQMPILDRGETEFYTFSVGHEGLGSMITSWSFPVSSPFIVYPFDNASDIDPSDTEIFIDGNLPIELLGLSSEANFEKLLIDSGTQSIIEGFLTLPEPIALEVAINPLSDGLSGYSAVSSGSALTLSDGLLLEMGTNVRVDASGLHPTGTHKAIVSYTGLPKNEWTATYSNNFTFGFAPFSINRGRVDFASDGVARAYADPTGFHLIDQSDPVIAQIPDRLQLPDEGLAYITLKRSGLSLVDIEPTANGAFLISEKQGVPLELTLPGLARGLQQEDQLYAASLEDVVIDPQTGQLISGKITAKPTGNSNKYTLDPLGIPIAPTSFVATNTPTGVKLDIEGQLTLFGEIVQNTEPIQLTLNEAGVVEGAITIESSDAYLFLDGEAGNISLDIASVSGSIKRPLNAFTPGVVGIDVTGNFNINKGDNIVASASLAFTYAGEGHVKFQHFSPISSVPQSISLDSYGLEIDEISSLEFFYSNASGLQYVAALEASLLPFNGGSNAKLRLSGIELHQNKFYVPTQEGHAGTANFSSFSHDVNGASLDLLAYRIPAATVSRKSENGSTQLSPYFDFEVQLNGIHNMPKEIGQFPLTLQDASIAEGIVLGNLLPYQITDHSAAIPLAAGIFKPNVLSGTFTEKEGQQAVQLETRGELTIAAPLASNTHDCSIANVTLTIEDNGQINGSSDPFEPCAAFSIGPVAARFEEATLSIESDENDTRYILSGSVEAFSRPGSRRTSQAEGPLSVDILTGKVIEADVDAENLFWEFPVAAPQFQISAARTNLSAAGFTLAGDSTVTINEIESSSTYLLKPQNTFRLGLKPTLSNIGRADLFISTNPDNRVAYFDETGFHPATVSETLPQKVLLPGGFGAYIDVLQAGDEAIELGKADKSGRTLQTKTGQTALLILPALGPAFSGSSSASIQLPISFEVALNHALEYRAGSFEQDLSESPVKLMGPDSPAQITGVRYDENVQQLLLTAIVSTPAAINDASTPANPEIEATFTLDATGLRAVNINTAPITLYNETLSLNIDEALIYHQGSRLALQLSGQLDSPILKHATSSSPALRFQSVYSSATANWSLNTIVPAAQWIAIDQAKLFLDPGNPPSIKAEPTLVLEMAGALAMPTSISKDFITDIAIEIGPGGVYAWQTGDLNAPRPFFNGFLTAYLDAIDMRYDASQQTLVTTIDGAFAPAITRTHQPGPVAAGRDNLSDLLPFSGIELASNGSVSFNSRGVPGDSADSIRLLGDLPRMPVISQSFWIEELILQTSDSGLSVELEGIVRLPTPDGRRVLLGQSTIGETSSIVYSDRIPVSITLDSEGRTFDKNGAPWDPLLLDSSQPDTTRTPTQRFDITSAYLHFNPLVAADNRIFTSSRIQVPAIQRNQTSDSTAVHPDASSFISLGDAASTKRRPGLIIEHQQPQQYLVTEIATIDKPALTIENAFFDTDVSSITLPNPEILQLELGGISRLKTQDIQGYFPVEGITLTPGRIQDYGQSAGPSALTFGDAGLFEIGCVDFGITNRSSNTGGFSVPSSNAISTNQTGTGARVSRLQFGRVCGDDLTLTLTDKYLAGSFGNLIFRESTPSLPEVQITNTQIDLAGLGALSANLSYNSTVSPPSLLVDGTTAFRGINLESRGAIKEVDGQTSVGILFNPANRSVDILDDVATATIAGGGFFLNPSTDDTELVNLILNERSNNSFSSNKPASEDVSGNQFSWLLPSEVKLYSQDSLAMHGTGLMTVNEHFTMFDLDGAFLNQTDKLSTGVFMVEKNRPDSSRSLEGLANISLNYTSVAGGIVKANFEAKPAGDGLLDWSVYGRSDIDVTDTARLPGQVLLTQAGLLIDLYSAANIRTAQLSLKNDLNLTLWSDQTNNKLSGYTAFEAEYDLIPGFALSSVKMFGGIIEDRDEHLFYAARNIFADVPFVYTGPIDPWLSFEDGTVYAGDARNTTFRRMITDARQFGNAVPEHTLAATTSLRDALDIQRTLAYDLVKSGDLPYFAQADSMLAGKGDNLLTLEKSVLNLDKLPAIFETLSDALYNDENHPDYRTDLDLEATNPRTLAALQNMNTTIDQAKRSADSDIFALSGLLPRPLLWNSDYVELDQTLATSPVNSISWPGQADTEQRGFIIDYDLQNTHSSNLLNFKQSNEGLDVQFLRTIGGLELNMVNLKIARSPNQAIDFNRATSNISQYYAMRIASDWEMLGWTKAKANWLQRQEDGVERGIRENLRTYNDAENSLDEIRSITQQRHNQVRQLSRSTDWKRDDLPEDQRFAQYLASLDEDALKEEFQTTAKNLWYDVPMAALTSLSDTLSSLIEIRNERFETGIDTLNKTYGAFSIALDPLYDIQTRFTTTLYGMAEEYRTWRSSIRRLDPEAVNYAFQFLPYRGNYRILSEDLIPPTIEDILITPARDGFLNNTKITWTADHPVELIETSLALSYDATAPPHFASLSQAPEVQFFTVKPNTQTTTRDVNVTLRVRGAGGIPAVKKGQFTVSVDEAAEIIEAAADTPLIPLDTTPPSKPQINDLSYSSYFSDTPNSLKFELAPLNDNESGIERIEYQVVNDRDEEEIIQDWTEIQKSTSYFAGRLIETSLPVQEENVSIRVTVRVLNEAGLSSETSESLSLKLDDSKPEASIANVIYFNAFDILHPRSLKLDLGPISDLESGIDLIEYALLQGGQSSLANANWQPLLNFPDRDTNIDNAPVYVDLQDSSLPDSRSVLSLYLRVTNGAGLQTIVNQTIEIPGRDITPPSEPLVTLEHTGFYATEGNNSLRIVVSGSTDLESGITGIEYRIIDGKTGTEISPWDDFVFLDPNTPTFILPANEKVIALPSFTSSRTIIVETRATNAAGIQSNKGVRFIQLDQDDTQPTAPSLAVRFAENGTTSNEKSILVDVGPSEDRESLIKDASYRIVNLATQQPLSNWQPLTTLEKPDARFPGITRLIDASVIPTGAIPGVQVGISNQQNLQTIVSKDLNLASDRTPPSQPALLIEAESSEDGESTSLTVYIGGSEDHESGISGARYQVKDLQHADSTIVAWTDLDIAQAEQVFPGKTVRASLPAIDRENTYRIDVELVNTAGLSTRVSGIVDQEMQAVYLQQPPAKPSVSLFHFNSENLIRQNELEVRISPNASVHTEIDSVLFKYTVFDETRQEIKSRGRSSWRSIVYRTQEANTPLTTFLPLVESANMAYARVDVKLVNKNGTSSTSQATLKLQQGIAELAPTPPQIDYTYTGYHNADAPNQLALSLNGIVDPVSRISEVSYRITDEQNPSDVVLDWSPVETVNDEGIFQPTTLSLVLPEFSRSRRLKVEARVSNGAGLTSTADSVLLVTVDRTAPELAKPELVISDINEINGAPHLSIYQDELSDPESKITTVAYRVLIDNDETDPLVDWTQLDHIKSHSLRFPATTVALTQEQLNSTFTVEIEAQNEAGLTANISEKVKANLDNSAPQMPRVEVSYRESELGTDYLLIEPGAFRDAESKISKLEYRLVDSQDPNFVLIDWITIPVPEEIRVSVAPIAIPRSEILYDGATQLAAEFRATNGAGLFSTRRSTIDLPGDISPPESPSLLVAHRNAYDPLHPNTVEIQIGASEDNQSAIAQAQYRITNASTGEELASWTQLSVASEGYFPGTILFEELPLIENSTSLVVEVEVLNTAGLVNTITQNVRVDIQNDATPPISDISLHYFENEMALVLDELSDLESKIQKVEYRFLDNVDQSELMGWTDLFEITIPQGTHPRQSFNVKQPAVSSGRTLKVEVRVTNGAGLQTTVSKTVLVRSPGSDQ